MVVSLQIQKPKNRLVRGIFNMKETLVYAMKRTLFIITFFSLGAGLGYLVRLK